MSKNEDMNFGIFPTEAQQAAIGEYGYEKMDAELRELVEGGGWKKAILKYLSRFGFGVDDVRFYDAEEFTERFGLPGGKND